MDLDLLILSIIVISFIGFVVVANIKYRSLRYDEVNMSDEEKFQEWLDKQW